MRNILFVAGYGGAPLDFALPKIKAKGKLHVLVPHSLAESKQKIIEKLADIVIPAHVQNESDLEQSILENVKKYQIDGIITLDEFSVEPVAWAAQKMGLKNAGKNVAHSRNKLRMRQAFAQAGLNNPLFFNVQNLEDLVAGVSKTGFPAVLKLAAGAGSTGHQLITAKDNLNEVWAKTNALIANLAEKNSMGIADTLHKKQFILESFIDATTDSWYEQDGFGDLISVEGLVKNGVYYPIALTSKLPMVPPFTEVAQITPCVLTKEKQKKIMAYAQKAVDSLQLENCGTHTEIKLQKNGGLCLVENAARLPGAVITKQIFDAFGIDLIGLLSQILLGNDVTIPPTQFDLIHKACGPLGLVSKNSLGEDWKKQPKINKNIDFTPYLPAEVSYEVRWSDRLQDNEIIPKYDPALGAMNYLAVFYFQAPTIEQLIFTQKSLMDQAESIFLNHQIA